VISFWAVSLNAGIYSARMWIVRETGNFAQTDAVIESASLATLESYAPTGMRRIPKFPTQPATVLENWV